MKIGTLEELEMYSSTEDDVHEILHDLGISRRKAVEMLAKEQLFVSQWIVRNYREKYVPRLIKDNVIEMTITNAESASEYIEKTYSSVGLPQYYYGSTALSQPKVTPTKFNGAMKPKGDYYIGDVPLDYEPSVITTTTNPFIAPVIKEGKARSSKTIVVMPDLQAPLHDRDLVDKFVDFLDDFRPNELAQVGDFTDSTEISRWVRGKKPEFAGDLQAGFDSAMDVLDLIRQVFDGRFRIVRSNHDDRLELYLQGCGPGLESLRDLTFEKQMHLSDFNVEFVRDGVVELTEDWIMGHGDEGSLSPQAGKTAFGLAKNKFGTNVVCGHTHRAGITTESYGYNGSIKRTLSGLEVGHFMDMKVADYLKKAGGHANWQQAFGILETINGKTFPSLVTVHNGSFAFEGQMY